MRAVSNTPPTLEGQLSSLIPDGYQAAADNIPDQIKLMATSLTVLSEVRAVALALLEWVDAVPEDTVLPAMPGVDRDWVESVLFD